MALSSMTGFARSHGASGPYAFEWELKSVNAKGFDLRMRLPPGWDELELLAKKRAGEVLSRGTVYANLNVRRSNPVSTVRINEEVLASIVKVAGVLAGKIDAVAPSIDGLLAIKGVIEVVEPGLLTTIQDFGRLITGSGRYAKAVASTDDPVTYATQLQRGGYATDTHYADKLIRAIRLVAGQGGTAGAPAQVMAGGAVNRSDEAAG